MTRQWKPGDVAMVSWSDENGSRYSSVAIRLRKNDGWEHGLDWGGGAVYDSICHPDARPLIVIDPEDREQVGRLYSAWVSQSPQVPNALQAALREFADPKPIKPAEPLGEWAVVMDVEGNVWTRMNDVHWSSEASPRNRQTWAEIDVARVLSEGVTE